MPSIFSADWRNEVNAELAAVGATVAAKANKATSLAGYGIADAYSKAQTDAAVAAASTNISAQLALKLDASAATSFLKADGSVVADKLTVNSSEGQITAGMGMVVRSTNAQANIYFEPATGYGHFLHANPSAFYILADRNRNRSWDTGRFPLYLNSSTDEAYVFGQKVFTYAGGQLGGILKTTTYNANTSDMYAPLEVRNSGGTGDGAVAAIGFHCNIHFGLKVYLRPDGYFGWGGWSSGPWRFYQSPAGDLVSAGNVAAYSDPRLKDDVERIDNALGIINQLDGVRFTWNGKTTLIGKPGVRDIGVLADQVEAVLPEIVSLSIEDEANDNERWRVVAYDKLVPVLIEAIKELTARVEALEAAR